MDDKIGELLIDCKNQLGEGIQWNADHQRVYWTDVFGNCLLSCEENGGDFRSVALETGLCSFAFTPDDKVLAAFADGLCWLDPLTGTRTLFEPYQPELKHTRMNDGCLDRQGRFVVGGIDEEKNAPITPVWSVSQGAIQEVVSGVGIANSLAFSPDGKKMYFADTVAREIFVYDYDTASGIPSNKTVFARVPNGHGKPDGSTVDQEGAVWNARFGGGSVQRYLADSAEDCTVTLPVPNVTCCAIGGRNLDRIFITTARISMTKSELENKPSAGGLFTAAISSVGIAAGKYAA